MEENKKKFNFGSKSKMYKPPSFGQKEMDDGLKKALSSKPEIKPLNISGQQRKQEKPMYSPMTMKKPEPQHPQELEQEPYWSAGQWEEWAYELFKNYPDTHEYLPDWFLEAMEAEK